MANLNLQFAYYFEIEKCKVCPLQEGCYQIGAKYKTYNVSILSEIHQEQKDFEATEIFKEKMNHRYMIEAKNAELKQRYNYKIAQSKGLFGMNIQGATAIFCANLNRILTLKAQNEAKE